MIVTSGTARFKSPSGKIFEVSPDELEWRSVPHSDGHTGTEMQYEATLRFGRDGEDGNCTWIATYYSVGGLAHVTPHARDCVLLADFHFGARAERPAE